ncbi:protein MFI-like isoform X2 [Watersipora subatra]|uniref:protein MFI-like isoform X2 n=1 Tax=Watersipora subatra TaxID=2589382 RepID=UPI00355BA6A4
MSEETLDEKSKRLAKAPKTLRKVLIAEQATDEARISAAIEIQRYLRGHLVRSLGPELYVAWKANLLQPDVEGRPTSARSHHSTRHDVSRKGARFTGPSRFSESRVQTMTSHQAASKIQRLWRKHIDMQVYRYYKDLISFKNQGDPAAMLRCVNPKEAALLDAASGTHVKFRLAGDRFPPNIYYKIYTHRPIQDLCANAPRDYTKSSKLKDMKCSHNRNYIINNPDSAEDWYRRIENNGWRLVSDRLIPHMLSDPVTWSTHNKPVRNFHHTKVLRMQDVEKARKRRKIDWMKKMYRDGMLQAKTTDPETMALVEGATSGMVTTLELEGEGAVAEWEVDELLEWTTSLNYEDYVVSWKQVGTTSQSENPADKRRFLTSNGKDKLDLMDEVISPRATTNTAQGHSTLLEQIQT